MSQTNVQQRPGKNVDNTAGTQQFTPKERYLHFKAIKRERADRDDTDVIDTKTGISQDFVNLLNISDDKMSAIALKFGSHPRVTTDFLLQIQKRVQDIKEQINLHNAEMCAAMNWRYYPPRGFTNPLTRTAPVRQQQQQAQTQSQTPTTNVSKKSKNKPRKAVVPATGSADASPHALQAMPSAAKVPQERVQTGDSAAVAA
jgi:hypothetical protein